MTSTLAMTKNQEKKEIERRVLEAARIAGAPIPNGELLGEEPDFRIHTAGGVFGIEISEVMRPASSNDGILPAEAEAFHQYIMRTAQETYQKTNAPSVRGQRVFLPRKGDETGQAPNG